MKTIKRLTVIFFAVLILWVPHGQVNSGVLERGAFMMPALTTRPMKQTSPQTLKIARTGTPVSKTTYASCEQYRPLLAQYDWNVDYMLLIMSRESQCIATKLNDTPRTKDYSVGLLQINLYGTNKNYRPSELALYDPATNIAQGYKQWKGSSYCAQWTTC